jgi:hypothetical protein
MPRKALTVALWLLLQLTLLVEGALSWVLVGRSGCFSGEVARVLR